MSELKRTPLVAEGDIFSTRVVSEGKNGTPLCYLTDGRICFLTHGVPCRIGDWVKAEVIMSGGTIANAEVLEILKPPASQSRSEKSSTLGEIAVVKPAPIKQVAPPVKVQEPLERVFTVDAIVRGNSSKHFTVGEEYRSRMMHLAGKDILIKAKGADWSFLSSLFAGESSWSIHLPKSIAHNFKRDTAYTFTLVKV